MRNLIAVLIALALLAGCAHAGEVMIAGPAQNVKRLYKAKKKLDAAVAAGLDLQNLPSGLDLDPNFVGLATIAAAILVLPDDLQATKENGIEQIKAGTVPAILWTESIPQGVCKNASACLTAADIVCGLDGRAAGQLSVMGPGCVFTCKSGGGTLVPLRGGIVCGT